MTTLSLPGAISATPATAATGVGDVESTPSAEEASATAISVLDVRPAADRLWYVYLHIPGTGRRRLVMDERHVYAGAVMMTAAAAGAIYRRRA